MCQNPAPASPCQLSRSAIIDKLRKAIQIEFQKQPPPLPRLSSYDDAVNVALIEEEREKKEKTARMRADAEFAKKLKEEEEREKKEKTARMKADAEFAKKLKEEMQEENRGTYWCVICQDDAKKGGGEYCLSECQHRFCRECFEGYVKSKIDNGQVKSTELICPEEKCGFPVSEFDIRWSTFVKGDKVTWNKYTGFLDNIAIEGEIKDGKLMRCPSGRCQNVFAFTADNTSLDYRCNSCKESFCLNCKAVGAGSTVGPSHAPRSCAEQVLAI
jgi:hypothetical protein